jgi:quinol monooxygenase YgiN
MPILHTAHLTCRADVIEQFRARLLRHAATTLEREPGCSRFDIHQETERPEIFLLIEIYDDEAALQAHRDAEHYAVFREDVKDWIAKREWWFWEALATG